MQVKYESCKLYRRVSFSQLRILDWTLGTDRSNETTALLELQVTQSVGFRASAVRYNIYIFTRRPMQTKTETAPLWWCYYAANCFNLDSSHLDYVPIGFGANTYITERAASDIPDCSTGA